MNEVLMYVIDCWLVLVCLYYAVVIAAIGTGIWFIIRLLRKWL